MWSYVRTMRFFSLVLIICSIMGCGFHFAGNPIKTSQLPDLHIRSELPSLWQQRLYRFLKVREVNNYPSSDLSLWIENFQESKRPVSLNSRAKVAEYSLKFSFTVRLTGKDNATLMTPKSLTTTRIYRFNEQQVPGKQAEEDFLKQAMIEDLFDQMLRHVDVALQNQPISTKPSIESIIKKAAPSSKSLSTPEGT